MDTMIAQFLEAEIEQGNIPGASIYVSFRGKAIMEYAAGWRTLHPEKLAVEENTIYDLASLTKVVATLPAILKLLDAGQIRLDDKVSYFFPAFKSEGKESVAIRHLLTHTSGLPAHRPFYRDSHCKDAILSSICAEQLSSPTGSKVIYSDLGFILLSQMVEKVADQPFEQFVTKEIFEPLNMTETGFNLPHARDRFAATVYSERLGDYKYGIVHDENAEALGGISGHAGLFSTLSDLVKFASMIENHGFYNGKRIISTASLNLARRNATPFDDEARGLGWQMKSLGATSCGDLFSQTSFGHTGYTGTSIWFDPEAQLHVILLTNRVHGNEPEAILRLRPRLHNLIRAQL